MKPISAAACGETESGYASLKCSECRNLTRVFELAQARHVEALSAAFYRVCTEIAAKREVDMERAANDLYEHQLICPLAQARPGVRPA